MDIKAYLSCQKKRVDDWLASYFSDRSSVPSALYEAMTYSLNAGGKRVRPILVLAACEAVGGDTETALPAAAAMECIHTFSLIHDDLPAMDNDDLRRGLPTNHKIFGEGMAILAGDGLLAESFLMLQRLSLKVSPEILLDVMCDIALATGAEGMIGGQVLDLKGEGEGLEEKDLEKIHRYKTGRLIAVSVAAGAKIGGAVAAELEALQKYGEKIGLAFQIADDILNVEGSVEEIGKSVGSDSQRKKATYPKILGLENSRQKSYLLRDEALQSLAGFETGADALRAVARFIVDRPS